jgi:hypothetical protein
MKQSPKAKGASKATIEHFDNERDWDKKYNLAICCRGCNSSKGTKKLSAWFKADYCRKRKINAEMVLKPVKEYMRLKKLA